MPPAEPIETRRFHSLDALRAGALLLGILLHASLSFLPGFREVNWPISDDSTSAGLGVAFFVIHVFRMAVFFLIAGFFARILRERLGSGGFLRNRLRRIGLPLVAFYLLVLPLTIIALIWGAVQLGIKGPPVVAPPIPLIGPQVPWGHLWFLYLLLVICALALAGRALFVRFDARGTLRERVGRLLRAAFRLRLAPVMLAVPLAAILALLPWWHEWMGIPVPITGLVPNVAVLAAYGGAFVIGWIIHREQGILRTLAADWALYLVVAALATGAALYLVGIKPRFGVLGLGDSARLGYAFAYTLAMWSWTFALLGIAVSRFDAVSARWRYLADASYWMYLIHLPIVMLLQAWMMRWPLHWSIKFGLILAITSILLLASYRYLVRSTFIGKFLNGRKYPRGLPATSAASISPG